MGDVGTDPQYGHVNAWICSEISTQLATLKPLADFTGEADDYDIFLDVQFNLAAASDDAIADADDIIFSFLLKERT